MSFVNLMANDVWSLVDIDNKVQALIRSKYATTDELKAARFSRKGQRTAPEAAFITGVDTWVASCILEGQQAKLDSALLAATLSFEAANRRLSQRLLDVDVTEDQPVLDEEGNPTFDELGNPIVEPVIVTPAITEFILDEEGVPTEEVNPEWDQVLADRVERDAAQVVVDAVTDQAVLDLYNLRNP